MSPATYNLLTALLLGGSLIALAIAAFFLVAAFIGWRSRYRVRCLVGFVICVLAFPILVGAHRVMQWKIFIPSLGREMVQQRHDKYNAASLVQVGEMAPQVKLTDIDSGDFDLKLLRGRVVLINFFATWCGPCKKELPHIQRLWERYGNDPAFGLIVIGVEDSADAVRDFRKQHGFTFPMAADLDRSNFSKYASTNIPRNYLIDRDGTICFASAGFYEDDFDKLEQELATQLSDSGSRESPVRR